MPVCSSRTSSASQALRSPISQDAWAQTDPATFQPFRYGTESGTSARLFVRSMSWNTGTSYLWSASHCLGNSGVRSTSYLSQLGNIHPSIHPWPGEFRFATLLVCCYFRYHMEIGMVGIRARRVRSSISSQCWRMKWTSRYSRSPPASYAYTVHAGASSTGISPVEFKHMSKDMPLTYKLLRSTSIDTSTITRPHSWNCGKAPPSFKRWLFFDTCIADRTGQVASGPQLTAEHTQCSPRLGNQ